MKQRAHHKINQWVEELWTLHLQYEWYSWVKGRTPKLWYEDFLPVREDNAVNILWSEDSWVNNPNNIHQTRRTGHKGL